MFEGTIYAKQGFLMDTHGIVEWDNRYTVGIQLIDDQHRELLKLINNIYLGCMKDDEGAKNYFRLTIHGLVNYIKYHFSTEEQLLARIEYPDSAAHKRQHSEFIRDIVERAESFERGHSISPKGYIRYIRDWIVTHITLIDKKYATYIHFINSHVSAPSYESHETPVFRRAGPVPAPASQEIPSELFFG
jgi:hemerythrin